MQDLPIAVYGQGQRGFEMSRALTAWSHDLVLCTDGPARLTRAQRAALNANRIAIRSERIIALSGRNGQLRALRFADGSALARSALFFDTPSRQQSRFAEALGCRFTDTGKIDVGDYEASSVPGVYVAGNILADVQLSIVAAAEGARAAFGMNRALTREDFEARAQRLAPRASIRTTQQIQPL